MNHSGRIYQRWSHYLILAFCCPFLVLKLLSKVLKHNEKNAEIHLFMFSGFLRQEPCFLFKLFGPLWLQVFGLVLSSQHDHGMRVRISFLGHEKKYKRIQGLWLWLSWALWDPNNGSFSLSPADSRQNTHPTQLICPSGDTTHHYRLESTPRL